MPPDTASPVAAKPPSSLPFHLLVLASSFLLFQIELIMARRLLPVFGSSAAVWTTCLMVYQGVLALGYAYGRMASKRIQRGLYAQQHLLVVALPALFFPFRLLSLEAHPILAITLALLASVAIPFAALSTTSIVAQAWFARTSHPDSQDPYPLYGSSNAGALLALLSYPFIFEPLFGLSIQLRLWYSAYALFVLLHLFCLKALRAGPKTAPAAAENTPEVLAPGLPSSAPARAPTWQLAHWMLLAGGANALLMASTNAVTVDAPAPLLWVLPLTLYLLTLIVCFGRKLPSQRLVTGFAFACLLLCLGCLGMLILKVKVQLAFIGLHSLILLIGCLLCHYRLSHARPAALHHLGTYYLAQSLGGWLGSVMVGLLMPTVFSFLAMNGADYLAAGLLIIGAFLARDLGLFKRYLTQRPARAFVLLALLAVSGYGLAGAFARISRLNVYSSRTFYGIYHVRDERGVRWFHHGNTIHGMQNLPPAPSTEPLGYYYRGSPISRILTGLPLQTVGIVGLGAGALSNYQLKGQVWDFYEIDPEVERIARDHFTFLRDSQAQVRVLLGDARLSLQKIEPARYDLLVMDTFSSDFMPMHLITVEAMQLYLSKVKPDGVVMFHISSRLFEVAPVLTRICSHLGLTGLMAGARGEDWRKTGNLKFPSLWYVISRNPEVLKRIQTELAFYPAELSPKAASRAPWTDDFSTLLHAL